MKYFKNWCRKFLQEDSPFGDVARSVINEKKCIPNFKEKEQIINFVMQTKYWNDSARTTIIEMLELWEQEEIIPYLEQIRKNKAYRFEKIYRGNVQPLKKEI